MTTLSACRFGPSVKKFFNTVLTLEAVEALATSREARTIEINEASFDGDKDGRIRQAFHRVLEQTGIAVETLHAHVGDISTPDARTWEDVLRRIQAATAMAREFGSAVMVFHSSGEPVEPSARRGHLDRAARRFRDIAAGLYAQGLSTAVEYLPRTCIGNSIEELLVLTHQGSVPGLGICFDVNHAMARIAEVPALIRQLEGRLLSVHLSDYHGVDEEHLFPGTGALDWPAVMNALAEIRFQGPLAYECPPPATPVLKDRIRLLDENIRWLRGE